MHRILLVLFGLIVFEVQASTAADNVSYDRLQQKSVHNAYQRKESLSDMLANRNIRSLELDIYVDKPGRPRLDTDWYVYHSKDDNKSSVDTLRQGLKILKAWHDSDPQHEVVTLFMDIKQDFLAGHQPEDLDRLLGEELGSALFGPGELLERCPGAMSLQAAVQGSCLWPTAGELRGRFLIVFTETPILKYVAQGQTAMERRAFIAPVITQASETDRWSFAVFFNMNKDTAQKAEVAPALAPKHLISRTWDLNDKNVWNKVVRRGVNHLATDKVDVKKDAWSTTLQKDGGSFAILP